jgi:hypothetical protein
MWLGATGYDLRAGRGTISSVFVDEPYALRRSTLNTLKNWRGRDGCSALATLEVSQLFSLRFQDLPHSSKHPRMMRGRFDVERLARCFQAQIPAPSLDRIPAVLPTSAATALESFRRPAGGSDT